MIEDTHKLRVLAPAVAAVVLAIVVVIAAAFGLGYARSLGSFATPAAPAQKLRVALPAVPQAGLLLIAAAMGYFAEEGLDVTLTRVSDGREALDLLAQGQADLASASEVPFVVAVLKGESLSIAASVANVSNDMAVVARRDHAIAVPHDLLGKRVGVTFGSSADYLLWAFLIRHKLAPESVTLVDVPPRRMVQALAGGTVDAVSTWAPIESRVLSELGGNALPFVEADAYPVGHVVVGRSELLRAGADVMQKVMRALLKAEDFNRAQPQQALRVVADGLALDVKTLEPGWKDIEFRVALRQSLLVAVEDEARWAMERGYATRRPAPNFLPHLYLDALLAVQPERVTVVH